MVQWTRGVAQAKKILRDEMLVLRNKSNRRVRLSPDLVIPAFEKYILDDYGVSEKLIQIESNDRKMLSIDGTSESHESAPAPLVGKPSDSDNKVIQPLMFGSFINVGNSLDIRPVVEQLWLKGHEYALPISQNGRVPWVYRSSYPHNKLIRGPMNTLIPHANTGKTVTPDIIFIPILAFDRSGFFVSAEGNGVADVTISRMRQQDAQFDAEIKQYGVPYEALVRAKPSLNTMGIYEILGDTVELKNQKIGLDKNAKPFMAIGVAYSNCEVPKERMPADTFDTVLDAIITEKELITVAPPSSVFREKLLSVAQQTRDQYEGNT